MAQVKAHAFGPNGELSPGAAAALTAWAGPGGGASALNDLTDVDTTGQTTGDVLKYNGTSWVADAASAGTVTSTDIGDSTAIGRDVLTAASQAAARTAIGAGTSDFDGTYGSLSGTPTLGTAAAADTTDFAPASHTTSTDHDARYVTVVEHGSTASTPRPAGATVVLWIGSVEPTNAVAGDQWDDASGSPAVYIEEPASDGTNGQVLTTDGAGGRSWTTISGSEDVTAADVDSEAATDGYVLTADGAGGAAWEAPSGGGGSDPWTYYVLSADVSTSSSTASAVTGLAIPSGLTAGTYELKVFVIGTHSGSGGFGYQVINPTGGDIRGWQLCMRASGEAAFSMMHVEALTNAGVSYVGMHYQATGVMTVASSTSSSVVLNFRSGTGSSTITAKPGSYMAIRKIA